MSKPHSSRFLHSPAAFLRGRVGRPFRAIAGSVVVALVVTLASATQPASAVPPTATAAKPEKVTSRPDLVSAQVTARAQGSRVEVEALRDEMSTTWVNPDGTLTTQQHLGPIRFRDAAAKDAQNPKGAWRDVDLSMAELPDGTVGPKGHPSGLSLAGAGKGADRTAKGATQTDLAGAHEKPGKAKQAREVTLGWAGALGKPVLSGTTATYKDVKPGVDLTVDARRTGYETHLVINTPQALAALADAAKGGPVSWAIPVKTKGLTARGETDGSVSFVDADGQVASRLAAPIAWDGVLDEHSGNRVNESRVAMTVTQKGAGKAVVTLTPNQDWLTSADRVFPVTIDPTYASASVTANFDTYASSAFPTAEYYTDTELRVGTYNGGGDKYRSFLQFPLPTFGGKDIVAASLSLYEFHSFSCTGKPFYAHGTTGQPSSATNWSNMPGQGTLFGTTTTAKGFSSSCAAGRTSVSVLGAAQYWAGHATGYGAIQLSASESDSYGWKKFYSVESSQDPYIAITYNRKPNAATALTLQTPPATTYLDPRDSLTYLFTTDSTPQFTAKATDPDGSTVSLTYEVHTSKTTSATTLKASCVTAYVASGANASCSPAAGSALSNSGIFYVRAAVKDDRGLWNGTWSPWTKFYTAYNNPPAPVVTCPGYADSSWTANAPPADVVCTIKATGVYLDYATPGYLDLTVDGVPRARQKITPTDDPNVVATTVTVPRSTDGAHSIVATAVSRTLKTTSKTHTFGWGGPSLALPRVGTATSGKLLVDAGGPPRGGSATVSGKIQWRISGSVGGAWIDGPALTPISAPVSTAPVKVATTWQPATNLQAAGVNTRRPLLLDFQYCLTYAGVATPLCTWAQSPRSLTWVPHAFGSGYPVAAAGPGQVALFTGEYNQSATDVSVPGYSGDLAIARTHTSFDGDGTLANWPSDPVTGVFGPGWTASLEGPEAGAAGLQVIDNTRQDGTIVLVDEEGEPLVYQNPDKTRTYKPGTPYLPATTDTTEAAADLTVAGTGTGASFVATSLTLKEEDGTVTTWAPIAYAASTTAYVPTADVDWKPVSVNEPGQIGSTTYGHDSSGRVTRIVAAVPPNAAVPPAPAVTCPTSGTLVKGCRGLDIAYATATTATSTTPGDYVGRVKTITATLWDPEANAGVGAMASPTVATYAYDISGRLVKVTDPRSSLGTDYTWDGTSARLASVKQTGMAAYRLAYDTTPSTPRVATVTRDNPAGSGAAVTLARYNYAVPLSGTGTELPDLTSDSIVEPTIDPVRRWYQASAPVAGYAVFGPDYTGPISGAGVDWTRADLQYADDQGYTVNTATFGAGAWQVTATDYDTLGNAVRELDSDATNAVKAAAAAGGPLDDGQVNALSSQTIYNADIKDTTGKVVTPAGTLVTDTYGPTRTAALVADLNSDGAPDLLPVRPHTKTVYDQNAPTTNVVAGVSLNPANAEPWRLPTTITTGVAASDATPGAADLETSFTTVNAYTKLNTSDATEGDPWVLGTPTKVTTGGITQTTRYDTEGKATETRQPLSTGSDAGTTKVVAYTAGANAVDALCGNKVEWAGLACRTLPAAAPSAGAGGAATLPDSRTTKYTAWLQPLTVVETSGAVTRTTETRYDTTGRTTASWTTTSGLTGSTARPGKFTHYRVADGLVDYTGNLNAAKTDADPAARSTSTFDVWGRTLTVSNDLADLTTMTYVAPGVAGAGSVATLTEDPAAIGQPNQTTTYTYDGTDADGKAERRGLVTGQTITRAGAAGGTGTLNFTAAYDDQGKLITQKLPGQVIQRTRYDEAGEPSGMSYSGTVQPVKVELDANGDPVANEDGSPKYVADGAAQPDQPWLAWSVVNDAQGRVRTETTGPAAGFDGNPGATGPADITPYDVSDGAVNYDRAYTYDGAGRLVTVADHTATSHASELDASPCAVRTYAFDANGRRTSLASATHADGQCTGTAGVTTTTTSSNNHDTADRPTLGKGGTGQYVYDSMGRQTTLPAVDAPNPAGGNITLGYFDDDLPRTITQNGTSTTFTLDSAGRRLQASTTTGTQSSNLVRHYTGGDDNPAWTVATDTLGQAVTTRYAESIGGDLGMSLASDGSADLTLATLHGDVVTSVPIAATAATGTAAAGIDGWSDYTEYGTPRDSAATAAVAGSAGYGWLGAKQRSTTSESAGLTLMGDRLYNAVTGRFTSLDPEPGGSAWAYGYPTDPVNQFDLDGHWWGQKKLQWGSGNGKWAKRFRSACSWAPGLAGTACGAYLTASYASRGDTRQALKWGATTIASAVGGSLVARGLTKGIGAARFAGRYAGRHRVVGTRAWHSVGRYAYRKTSWVSRRNLGYRSLRYTSGNLHGSAASNYVSWAGHRYWGGD